MAQSARDEILNKLKAAPQKDLRPRPVLPPLRELSQTKEELIEKFTLEAVGKSAAAINPGKLDWLNAQYIKKIELEELVQNVRPFV